MLETLRAYGRQRLQARGEAEAVARRHATYYTRLVEQLYPRSARWEATPPSARPPSREEAWFASIEAEQANVRAALAWAVRRRDTRAGLRLCSAIWLRWTSAAPWPRAAGGWRPSWRC